MKKQVSPLVTVIVILVVVVIVALLWNYFTTRTELPAGAEVSGGPIREPSPAEVAKWKGRHAELMQEARDKAAQANEQAPPQRRTGAAAGGPGGKGE